MHVILFSLYYMFSARRFPPLATVGCATFQFSCWLSAVGLAPPATMVACGRVLILVSLVLAPVFSFNSPFFVSPPRHADDTREGFDGGWSCHSAFFVSPPPPHWRYAAGFDGWLAFLLCLRFLQLPSSRFSWLHSQAVQRCGSGF